MNVGNLAGSASEWLGGAGPHSDVVVSSRVRLARNVAGFPFLATASEAQKQELVELCRRRLGESHFAQGIVWIDLNHLDALDRQLLVERHLISRQHSHGQTPRGAAISTDEAVAVMVNEEDHLRIQVLRSGMQLTDVSARADQIDNTLEQTVEYAFSPTYGYLTACPTNVGTGIRVSVMLHLPALKMTGEIDKVKRAARDMHLAVRGFHGEGTDAVGDLYQVSNQTTLGKTEREILTDFEQQIIPKLIDYEHAARRALAERRASVMDDKIHRAWGILRHARLLKTDEALHLLSHVRLGVALGRIQEVDMQTLGELILLSQPAHLQKMADRAMDGDERRAVRAQFIRNRLGG
jgi:protein arginine kinase